MLEIHYELRLPADTSDDDVIARLERLREHALGLDVADVTPLWRVAANEFSVDLGAWGWRPLPRFSRLRVQDARNVSTQSPPGDKPPLDVAGFFIRPARDSECAAFGLVRPTPKPSLAEERDDESLNWYWGYSCREHGSAVVRMLGMARELGFEVSWRDAA